MTQEQRDQIKIEADYYGDGFRISKSHTFYDWTRRDFSDAVYEHLKEISYFVAPVPKAKATKAVPEQVQATAIATETQAVAVTENDERDGVEIRFDSKPEQEVVESLKAAGFRWSRFNSCWYAKRNAETLAFAASLEAQASPAPTEVETEVHLEMLAIAPAKATTAFLPQAIVQPSAYSGYTVVQEAVTYAPVVVSGRSPQQELKDKLAALNVDALDAEQISLLLKAIS